MSEEKSGSNVPTNFIKTIINKDLENNKNDGNVHTRFPPEPNGYLHIGHAKSICLNFGIATEYKGTCNLRFDDTNPSKEDDEYVHAITEDVEWLGFDFGKKTYYASDYFGKFYDFAVQLIKAEKAYVDELTADEMREYRGTLTEAGKASPYRDRPVAESLDLFEKMKNGELEEGSCILRAKIDMASPNMNMRDPAMYRIQKASHHRTGDTWNIYPMYDFAHPLEDSLEGITHSLCTLEFEDHRPLYDWFILQLNIFTPQQIEFARLNLSYTIMSKRNLRELVEEKHVNGWDDPRMPTISGLRRRGYTPEAIKNFMERIGISKGDSVVDVALLEHCLRENLNKSAKRVMGVLKPIKLIITNYPEGKVEEFDTDNNPEDESAGKRKIPFSRELYIEESDFMEDAPKKYFRMALGREVRLKEAYYVTCTDFKKDENGKIVEVHATYDSATRGGWSEDGRRVKGTMHWVSVQHAIQTEVRLYDRLFTIETPRTTRTRNFKDSLNPNSLEVITNCFVEPSLASAKSGERFQFLRNGYFCVDLKDSKEGALVFNRAVSLKDSWKK